MKLAYVNGRFLPHARACVHIEDRGYQFADGVYEVWAVIDGVLADTAGHMQRLERSLGELRIEMPMSQSSLSVVLRETVRRNRLTDGLVYLQITRGVAPRDHSFPTPAPRPSVVVTAKRLDWAAAHARAERGVSVITVPDNRWGRCDIKTIGLLPNVLAKQAAREAGAYEAWFIDDAGLVTEGSSTNAWIVDRDGVLRTRSIQSNILRGVTRLSTLALAETLGLPVEERPFTVEDVKGAQEAFITSASSLIMPVIRIDGANVGDGSVGDVAKRLRQLYIEHVAQGGGPVSAKPQ